MLHIENIKTLDFYEQFSTLMFFVHFKLHQNDVTKNNTCNLYECILSFLCMWLMMLGVYITVAYTRQKE